MNYPFIHLNFAVQDRGSTSLDRDFAGSISCETDWQRVHSLRERYDAIAVGGRTWITDRPYLTVRRERLGREPLRQPACVVFAGSQECQIHGGGRQFFMVTANRREITEGNVIPCYGYDLRQPLETLYDYGIRSMLVEGGPTLIRSFLRQGFADTVTVFVRGGARESAEHAARCALPDLPFLLSSAGFGKGILLASQPTHDFVSQKIAAFANGG